ncbi:MAG: rod shape-determining protein MreC [Alphaproteobacteria bacterium]|nr:rod shape-determining protein MreC [Alphaproteobacteria bacterium]
MIKDKSSYRLNRIIKAALAAATVPVIIIYIMVAKPDYTVTNSLAHFFLPIAHGIGSAVTWPIRTIGQSAHWVREMSNLSKENKMLRMKLDEVLAKQNECDIAIEENKKLEREIDIKRASPFKTVIADIQFDDSVFHYNTFLINRGKKDGITKGMVVVSFENQMVGTVTDCGSQFCRVRALMDTNTKIAVRIAGSDISGFLQGNGKSGASIGFFNDTQFIGRQGLKVITSNISGVLPSGIYVGEMIDDKNVKVLKPNNLSRVMVLQFDNQGSYK